MKSITRKIAVVAAGFAGLVFSNSANAAEISPWSYTMVNNVSYRPSRAYVYKAGSYGSYVGSSSYTYGNYSYWFWIPYFNTNYQHWLYDFGLGKWDTILTERLNNY